MAPRDAAIESLLHLVCTIDPGQIKQEGGGGAMCEFRRGLPPPRMDRAGHAAYIAAMSAVPFIKMHGLGNDFVVLDARQSPLAFDDAQARAIADRHTGVGCDQLIVLEPPHDPRAQLFMAIRNADGGLVEACGNAARCVADLVQCASAAATAPPSKPRRD